MAHYAFLDENNIVTEVITGIDETELIDGIDPETWYSNFRGQRCVRTSINTKGGIHKDNKTPLRKNYAGVGAFYNEEIDAFIGPQPYLSWALNTETGLWEPPLPYPEGTNKNYIWNESTLSWNEVE
jgi:hypothetical protein